MFDAGRCGLGGAEGLGLVEAGGLGGRLTGEGTLPFLATLFVDGAIECVVLEMYLHKRECH